MITRNDFESRLKNIFDWTKWHQISDVLKALVTNDTIYLTTCTNTINQCISSINGYLSQWDAATTDAQRMAVLGSVVVNF